MLRQLGKHRIFLRGQMHLFPVAGHGTPEQVDGHATRHDRFLVGLRADVEQV
jgi:hypothetical protein